jgi:RNA-directed DNA polymerase
MGELKVSGKPFEISKWAVWEAWQKVKANKGAPGVDGQSIAEFEKDLQGNLYKIWNRMSSGSYFPPPVRAVEIAKAHGAGTRMLGVPTVADRVAQTVVAQELEARVEPIFHPDSYGYRPRRSALDAVAACRRRCWQTNWVIDLDIRKFFDSVPWERVVTAVEANTDLPWVVLYVKRWLHAPLQLADGSLQVRDRGTPQDSAVSPVLANLFLHYAFDLWMTREFPGSGSSAMWTMRSCTASARPRPIGCWPPSWNGCARWGWNCIRTRPGLCTARTAGDVAAMSTPRSPSSGTHSGRVGCARRPAQW